MTVTASRAGAHFDVGNATLHHGDCLDVLPTLDADSFDSCVTDPPYHLTQASRGGHARTNSPDSPHGRHRIGDKGFMGRVWDGGDVAMRPETWAEVLRVLKPGAYLLAFGGTRTFHRVICAIEDAGFEIRDCIMWVYGSGFPKGTDKAKIPEAWQGWNTALKPAWEPIVVARKPFASTLAANLEQHGTGAMNIDGCRIPAEPMPENTGRGALPRRNPDETRDPGQLSQPHELGRWPANLIHDGDAEVVALFPDAPGQLADASSSSSSRKNQNVYGAMRRGRGDEPSADSENEGAVGFKMRPGARRLDSGSAARFFYCAKTSREDRNEGCELMERRPLLWSSGEQSPGTFQAEGTDRTSQNNHPTVKPTELMAYLCRLVTRPGGVILDPFMGSGSTGKAAKIEGFGFVGIDLEEHNVAIAKARIAAVPRQERMFA